MSARVSVLFVSVAILWGVPYVMIKAAPDRGAEPLLIAWTRVTIGAGILIVVTGARGQLRGLRRHAGLLTLVALFDVTAPQTSSAVPPPS